MLSSKQNKKKTSNKIFVIVIFIVDIVIVVVVVVVYTMCVFFNFFICLSFMDGYQRQCRQQRNGMYERAFYKKYDTIKNNDYHEKLQTHVRKYV